MEFLARVWSGDKTQEYRRIIARGDSLFSGFIAVVCILITTRPPFWVEALTLTTGFARPVPETDSFPD